MDRNIQLELLDGKSEDATLSSAFEPNKNEIEVFLNSDAKLRRYPLSEICCIQMKDREIFEGSANGRKLEEVTTSTGKKFRVRVVNEKPFQTGFYGVSLSEDSLLPVIFFTFLGIKSRRHYRLPKESVVSKDQATKTAPTGKKTEASRPLGEIIQEKAKITSSEIEEAIREQKELQQRKVGEIIADHTGIPQETIDKTIIKAKKEGKTPARARVGDILVAAGLVSREKVEEALASQQQGKKKRIGEILIEKGLATEEQILAALATKFHLQFIDLNDVVPNQKTLSALPRDLIEQLKVFPVEDRGTLLVVATSDPTDPNIADTLHFNANRSIELVVASSAQIAEAFKKNYTDTDLEESDQVEDLIDELDDDSIAVEEERADELTSGLAETDSTVIRLVNTILIDAYKKGVSDIHMEPSMGKKPFQVRYRIDGVCAVAHKIPTKYKRAVVARIKIMANLDIAERRKPQSGKILLHYRNRKVEFRVETTPTVGGNEDAVLRILASSKPIPLHKMGFSELNLKNFLEVLKKPYGIILCVGPTGSGKTTTLHSALAHINTPETKIWTAEDPVEITQEGLRQVQVLPKIGFNFAAAMRSFLRADPDVIMIGEMRDQETAKIAIEASLTGHLVFSTLHTNSAPETVVRLIEMGMDPFNFAEALLGVLAQRLGRRLCGACKQPYHPDQKEYDKLVEIYGPKWYKRHNMPAYTDDFNLMKLGEGGKCPDCAGSGLKGRVAFHELLLGTERLKLAIKENATADILNDIAMDEGMTSLKMDGILKTLEGHTMIENVLKVCL